MKWVLVLLMAFALGACVSVGTREDHNKRFHYDQHSEWGHHLRR